MAFGDVKEKMEEIGGERGENGKVKTELCGGVLSLFLLFLSSLYQHA